MEQRKIEIKSLEQVLCRQMIQLMENIAEVKRRNKKQLWEKTNLQYIVC